MEIILDINLLESLLLLGILKRCPYRRKQKNKKELP
jgi:hypothetical protein